MAPTAPRSHRATTPRSPSGRGQGLLAVTALTLVSILLGTGTGWSYWTAAATGWGSAGTGTLTAPTDVEAANKAGSPGVVVVTWTASTVNGGPPQGYRVTRVDAQSGTSSFGCGTSASELTAALTCEDQPQQDGDYYYRLTTEHHSWTEVSSPSGTVTVDAAAPAAPAAPDLVAASDSGTSETDDDTMDTTPTFSGTAEPGATVTLFVGAVEVGDDVALEGSYSITTPPLANATHTVTATATDGAGNTGPASPATQIAVDTVGPTVTVEQESGQDDPTNDEPIHFTVTFSEPVWGFTAADLQVSAPVGSTVVVTGTGPTYDVAVSGMLDDLTVALSVEADAVLDRAGNGSSASTSADGSVTLDTVGPETPTVPDLVASSDSGASTTDEITNDTTPTFVGNAEPGSTVSVYGGGVEVGTGIAAEGAYAITTTTLVPGTVSITAAATDAAGNVGPTSGALGVTIDIGAPVAVPSAPDLAGASDSFSPDYDGSGDSTDSDDYTHETAPLFSGTAEAGVTVTLTGSDNVFVGRAMADTDGVYSVQVQPSDALTNGVHAVSAAATDVAGNTGPPSADLTLTVDTVAPDLAITAALYTGTASGVEDVYRADFAGKLGVDAHDGGLRVLLCTTLGCETPVPGPVVQLNGSTWSRSSDPVYSCSRSGARVCGGTDPVHAVASQVDRAGNSAVVADVVDFPDVG